MEMRHHEKGGDDGGDDGMGYRQYNTVVPMTLS